MEEGIYYSLLSKSLMEKLSELKESKKFVDDIDRNISAKVFATYFSEILQATLESLKSGDDKIERQIALINNLIKDLPNLKDNQNLPDSTILKSQVLKGLFTSESPYYKYNNIQELFPHSGIIESELFTGNNAGISLESEIKKEIMTSDEICFLVSFIKWSGLRIIIEDIRKFVNRGGTLRVISTSYMGATDSKAIHELSKINNVSVKVSYNVKSERLHAKAYLFKRNSGFDTGFIGSSNMSRSALTNGLEWNVKITTKESPQILKKFEATFESYWEDREFEPYDPKLHEKKLNIALKEAKTTFNVPYNTTLFNLNPFSYQSEILEKLNASREIHNKWRNLIVAATGTGKTIISAFDYKRFKRTNSRSRLLFVAHRKEILKQAMDTYRQVLKDNNFGDHLDGNFDDLSGDHIFISVQKLKNRISSLSLSSDHFDYIIIDEVHHISAKSYRPILEKFSPKILLGLTATPERLDGQNILDDFGGSIDAEIRLPDALNRKLLSPFHYFGITDSVDLTNVKWSSGGYNVQELSELYTKNDRRVNNIVTSLIKYTLNPQKVKALGFCVNKNHAKFMTQKFNQANLKSDYLVSGEGSVYDRSEKKAKLERGEINYLFVVDVFNEGVDLPELDTVLFLRPTESLTIFLQQLGRGLRLSDGKECLTVLDFVGNAREEYRFSEKFRALIGRTKNRVKDEIESGFPHLPLGCSIILERKAKEYILDNITRATSLNVNSLVYKINNWPNVTTLELNLKNFVQFYSIPIEYIYKKNRGWEYLKSRAKGTSIAGNKNTYNVFVNTVMQRWLTCNSLSYFEFIRKLANYSFQLDNLNGPGTKDLALIFYYDFWKKPNEFKTLTNAIKILNECPSIKKEVIELMELLISKIDYSEKSKLGYLLKIHSRYNRDQILSAFGASTYERKKESREGSFSISESNTELLFVTLDKNDGSYSPSTSYDDYALSDTLFHWQSQNSKGPKTKGGKAYIHHEKNNRKIFLFVREMKKNTFNNTLGFVFLGKVNYVSHKGSKPMSIIWKLETSIPSFLLKESEKLKVG